MNGKSFRITDPSMNLQPSANYSATAPVYIKMHACVKIVIYTLTGHLNNKCLERRIWFKPDCAHFSLCDFITNWHFTTHHPLLAHSSTQAPSHTLTHPFTHLLTIYSLDFIMLWVNKEILWLIFVFDDPQKFRRRLHQELGILFRYN